MARSGSHTSGSLFQVEENELVNAQRTVLVTGASGGLGAATTSRFVEEGWTVFAADLTPPPARPGVVPVPMDVSDTRSVDNAFNQIREHAPGLDCVVSFAGVLSVGPLAEMADDKLQRIVDINIMGTHRTIRGAFPALLAAGGRVILISSETGWQHAMPFNGAYALTKHAVEAYGDALRRELACVDMPVSIIQPGPFQTSMTSSIEGQFAESTLSSSPFATMAGRVGQLAADEHRRAHPPEVLAEVVVRAASVDRPRIRYSVRPDRMRALADKLPVRLVDVALRKVLSH
ncbi:SDR family NAD(P)-dependent oxidoreductase [Nocardia sp. NPDC005825]|uniref:SDR family NAD(P)-dependent oxidoreductase n=1 Tax=unclassified Nocardia TaxID=2637762 RepID=UPI00340F40B3